jgi:hypothetical protein
LTRRRLVGVAAGAAVPLAAGVVPASAHQQGATPAPGTPVASPAAELRIDVDALYAVSQRIVGGGELDRDAAEPLALLLSGDPARVSGFEELAGIDDPSSKKALDAMSDDARMVVDDIVRYWYLGFFEGKPAPNRAEMFFGLPVWSTVPYVVQPTVCKGFGYWASDVDVEG